METGGYINRRAHVFLETLPVHVYRGPRGPASPMTRRAAWFAAAALCFAATPANAASDGLGRLPMRGWDTWNWIGVSGCSDACASVPGGLAGRCHSEVMFRGMADAVAKQLLPAGYNIITLSEGWPAQCFRAGTCSGRYPNGTIMQDPDRYPSGIPALAEYVHSLGLKFGAFCVLTKGDCHAHPRVRCRALLFRRE